MKRKLDASEFKKKKEQGPGKRPRALSLKASSGPAPRTGGWKNPTRTGELKYIDVSSSYNIVAASTTWSAATLLNGCVLGSDATQRIGRRINLKSLHIRGFAACAAGSTGGSPVRVLVVFDKQANATAPAITDILLANDYSSPNNLNNRDRFLTLADYIIPNISVAGDFTRDVLIYKALNLETTFNSGSAGTIGDITTGSVYMFICQTGGLQTANGGFYFRTRIRYLD